MENLADPVLQLHLQEPDTYQVHQPVAVLTYLITLLQKIIAKYINEFLRCCNATTIGPSKKRWVETSVRTKKGHIAKAKNLVVAGLGDAGHLWETLRNSGTVEKEFGIAEESPEEQKYLNALVETYWNTSCWETRRQVLSVMADLISFKRIQHHIPGLTEYHFKNCEASCPAVWAWCRGFNV